MRTILGFLLLLLVVAMLTSCASVPDAPPYKLPYGLKLSDAVLLRVRVLNIEDTGYVPLCDTEAPCINFSLWDRYHAQVLEVVHGSWEGEYIDFARLESARYIDSVTDDCFVILTKLDPGRQEKFHVEYHAYDIVSHDQGNERNIRNLVED